MQKASSKIWTLGTISFPNDDNHGHHIQLLLLTFFEFFHTNVSRLFLTGFWVTAYLFKSPGLFIIIIVIIVNFSHQPSRVVFQWSLCDSKSPRIFMILISIQVDFDSAVAWMLSFFPLIFNTSCHFSRFLETISRTLINIGDTVNFMFLKLFNIIIISSSRKVYLFLKCYKDGCKYWSSDNSKALS